MGCADPRPYAAGLMLTAAKASLLVNVDHQGRIIFDQHVTLPQDNMTMAVLRKAVHRNHIVDAALSREIGRDRRAGEYGMTRFRSFLDVEVGGEGPVWRRSNAGEREPGHEGGGKMACRHGRAPDRFRPRVAKLKLARNALGPNNPAGIAAWLRPEDRSVGLNRGNLEPGDASRAHRSIRTQLTMPKRSSCTLQAGLGSPSAMAFASRMRIEETMRFGVAMAFVAFGLGGCGVTTYTSNLAFDVTQRAYVTDSTTQAVVVSSADGAPHPPCSGLIVC